MSTEYAPREGSVAHMVIEYLRTQGATATLSSAEISEKFGGGKGVSTLLRKCVDVGLLVAEKVSGALVYSLPEPEAPTDGELQIAMYSDGDVSVAGGAPTPDGGVMYTRTQLEQLIRRVTNPHIVLSAQPA